MTTLSFVSECHKGWGCVTVTQDDACDCSVTESESRPGLKLERRCFVPHLYFSLCVWVEKATAWKVKVEERRIIWSKAELILFGGGWYLRLENCEVMRLGAEKWDFWKRRGRKKTMETAKYQEPFRVSPSSLSLKFTFISMVCHLHHFVLWPCYHYQGKDIAKYREPFRVSPTR